MLNIIYLGFSFLPEYKRTFTAYLMLIVGLNVYSLVNGDNMFMSIFMTILCSLPFFFVMGIVVKIRTYPIRKKREEYQKMFESIGLRDGSGQYPIYQGQEDAEYVTALVFQAKIPVETWMNKQALLETYLNKKIVKIKNFKDDKNVIDVLIENKPLPTNVPWEDEHTREKDYYVLGIDHFGYVTIDLNSTPHTFIAGESGSGKSNILKCLIHQSIIKGYKVKLIDFKRGVSFALFKNMLEVYSTYDRIQILLESLVDETNHRLDLLVKYGVEDIKDYNRLSGNYMERMVVFIDELAELMKSSDKDTSKAITARLETLTRLSRAVGIHLIMGLQRPDSTIINGQIKNNVSMRVCGRFVDPEPSRIMLGNDMATRIPQIKGRFILRDNSYREFQAFYLSADSVSDFYYKANTDNIYQEPEQSEQEPILQQVAPQLEETKIDFNFDDII